ncbi:MAG TPA: ABC transporter ATP-binding protein [Desulfatiglandales bacterium]|nr:MAG: ABC transporter ATP-binding protein [Bacteroidia bacterium]HUV58548.1 ABC transporter ATP-binding protein [Desulfatiglandales bacterium]
MLLSMENVTTGYGKAQVLKKVNISLEKGEIVALIGANGAGKTTSLRCITGIIKPWEGTIKFNNQKIDALEPYEIVSFGISYCPEGRDIFANLSVYENLKVGAYLVKDRREFKSNLNRIYELFPRLQERRNQIAGSLSGGEQQMLAIGRALMSKPSVLLLDEPSLGLAPIIMESIFETIKQVNSSGTSILLVEQNVSLALDLAERAYVLEKGEIKLSGESKDLRESEYVKNSYLGIT